MPPVRQKGWNGTPAERLERMTAKVDGCIVWIGRLHRSGYADFYVDGKLVMAHRFAYEQANGPIPEGMQLDHLCRNRRCVNPNHLEPVTSRENTMRSPISPAAVNARKTHCVNGHALDGENLRIDYQGYRRCIACQSARSKRHHARKLAALREPSEPQASRDWRDERPSRTDLDDA
jgi:hypothetical protein